MYSLRRRAWPALLLAVLFLFPLAVSPVTAQTLDPVDDITAQLMIAIVQRNFDTLSSLIGEQFTLALWQSEGVSLTRDEAVAQLETSYFTPQADIAFNTTEDLHELLGQDPAALLGPDVQVLRTLYVKGLGSGNDEAILFIAAEPGGDLHWRGMLVAPGGFRNYTPPATAPATPVVLPADEEAITALRTVALRSGPGEQFGQVGFLAVGRVLPVLGISADARWWNVACPAGVAGACWAPNDSAQTRPAALATATPLPTSTARPANTPRPTNTLLPPSTSGRPQRIQFAPNATSATVQGRVEPFGRNQYVLRAMAGQTMYVELQSAGGYANFAISGVSDGQPYKRLENEARSYSFPLPRSQDYLITVGTADVGVTYTLFVSVTGSTRPTATPSPTLPQRVNFTPGATSVSLQGSLAAGGQNQYLLRAVAGQTMYVELEAPPSGVSFAITGVSDGQPYKRLAVASRTFQFVLPMTQDYLIAVASDGLATSYSLFVSITGSTRPTATPEAVRPVRVNFAPGATSASLQGSLAPNGQSQYLLRALAGQTMHVELEAPPSGVNFAITGVSDGQPYKRLAVASRSFEFVLPTTQDYLITVAGDGPATSYSLFVSIY